MPATPCVVCGKPVEYDINGQPISRYWRPGTRYEPYCGAECSLTEYDSTRVVKQPSSQ